MGIRGKVADPHLKLGRCRLNVPIGVSPGEPKVSSRKARSLIDSPFGEFVLWRLRLVDRCRHLRTELAYMIGFYVENAIVRECVLRTPAMDRCLCC